MKNLDKIISGSVDGFIIQLSNNIDERINQLQETKNAMVDCLFQSMNDELGLEINTIGVLQNFYLEAERQIQNLQNKKLNHRAFA